eukprot:TRINITY_DN3966_c0_g3_i2.p1 TRINITY_DN3966_c0_g3~~TRINITY_DN3966_c0_g3_i2.p1  ORF type:complete len:839 (+),score=239.92 TRINITY_DN3966_c0_g3_i2:122-2518(+)
MAAAVHEAMLALSPQPGEREFHCTLQSLRVRFSSQTAADLFARADADCDGVLTPDELARWGLTYPRMLQTLHYRLTDVRGEAAADEEAKAAARRCDDMRQALATATADEEAARQAVGAVEAALAAEIKEVERLRAVQEQRRALEHGDPNDVLSEEQGQRIAAALLQAGAGPADRYDRHYASASAHDVKAFASRLEAEWGRKGGDVVDELMANLCAPKGTPVPQKLTMLAEAARLLHDGKSAMYPGRSRVELLVLALYTMAGPDIDALMGYQDAPAAYDPKQQDDWQQYCDRHPDRNKAIFSTINWAVRTAADPQQPPESVDDAWTVVRRWTKFIALLLATCAQPEPMAGPRGRDVFRGLAGLPGNVHAAHKAMEKGAELHWPSASSCALLRRVSEDYIAGRAANATRQDGGAVLFLVSAARLGVLLKSISKYPDEDEMLLPPLSAFRVQDVQQGETAAGGDDEAAAVLSLTFTGGRPAACGRGRTGAARRSSSSGRCCRQSTSPPSGCNPSWRGKRRKRSGSHGRPSRRPAGSSRALLRPSRTWLPTSSGSRTSCGLRVTPRRGPQPRRRSWRSSCAGSTRRRRCWLVRQKQRMRRWRRHSSAASAPVKSSQQRATGWRLPEQRWTRPSSGCAPCWRLWRNAARTCRRESARPLRRCACRSAAASAWRSSCGPLAPPPKAPSSSATVFRALWSTPKPLPSGGGRQWSGCGLRVGKGTKKSSSCWSKKSGWWSCESRWTRRSGSTKVTSSALASATDRRPRSAPHRASAARRRRAPECHHQRRSRSGAVHRCPPERVLQ